MTVTTTLIGPREAVDFDVNLVDTPRGQARLVQCRHCGYNTQKWQKARAIETYETHWRVRHPEVVKQREADTAFVAFRG